MAVVDPGGRNMARFMDVIGDGECSIPARAVSRWDCHATSLMLSTNERSKGG